VSCVMGQALLLSREVLWVYAFGLMTLFYAFVRGYEEPTLSRRFGAEYDAYRRAVPGWHPRLRRTTR
jgi:protein-S-isoprenylcysteine O-methyltransferase Ste14